LEGYRRAFIPAAAEAGPCDFNKDGVNDVRDCLAFLDCLCGSGLTLDPLKATVDDGRNAFDAGADADG